MISSRTISFSGTSWPLFSCSILWTHVWQKNFLCYFCFVFSFFVSSSSLFSFCCFFSHQTRPPSSRSTFHSNHFAKSSLSSLPTKNRQKSIRCTHPGVEGSVSETITVVINELRTVKTSLAGWILELLPEWAECYLLRSGTAAAVQNGMMKSQENSGGLCRAATPTSGHMPQQVFRVHVLRLIESRSSDAQGQVMTC